MSGLSSASKKKIKNYAVYSLILVVGAIAVYLIMLSDQPSIEDNSAINTELPEPEDIGLPDKREAYVEEEMSNLSLGSLYHESGDLFLVEPDSSPGKEAEAVAAMERARQAQEEALKTASSVSGMVADPAAANRHRNELEQARKKQEELERQLRKKDAELRLAQGKAEFDDILQNSQQGQENSIIVPNVESSDNSSRKTAVTPVSAIQKQVVSTLGGIHRSRNFYGVNNSGAAQRNTIKASVYGKQIIKHGQTLLLRLSEPMQVGQQILPTGAEVAAFCQITSDRLMCSITNIEYGGIVFYVELQVFDAADGQPGLCLPGSLEQEAIHEVGTDVANAVANATSQSIAIYSSEPNAAEQIKTDVGRGLISGVSRFIGRRLMEIKVTVQDSHRVLLVSQIQ
jgi:conjugative transposon TraM protein